MGEVKLTPEGQILFSDLLDMAPELCRPHEEILDPYKWDHGCIRNGISILLEVIGVEEGRNTREDILGSHQKYPACDQCPHAPGVTPESYRRRAKADKPLDND